MRRAGLPPRGRPPGRPAGGSSPRERGPEAPRGPGGPPYVLAVLLLVVVAGFAYGLLRLFELRFAEGDIYPPYSSLRSDPLGAKALHDSLALLPGISVTRNFRPLERLACIGCTVFLFGLEPFDFEHQTDEHFKELEKVATGGARVVIAMRPVRRLSPPKPGAVAAKKDPPTIEKRWGVAFGYIVTETPDVPESRGSMPKQTALYFLDGGKRVSRWEHKFGDGVIILVTSAYPFSNEALDRDRDTELLASLAGPSKSMVFDEAHLGVSENQSVGALIRKYQLQGVVAALLLLAGLFAWKNSASLLPAKSAAGSDDGPREATGDAVSGLAHLLRRHVPRTALFRVCITEWERSRSCSPEKTVRVKALAANVIGADEGYRKASRILAERT